MLALAQYDSDTDSDDSGTDVPPTVSESALVSASSNVPKPKKHEAAAIPGPTKPLGLSFAALPEAGKKKKKKKKKRKREKEDTASKTENASSVSSSSSMFAALPMPNLGALYGNDTASSSAAASSTSPAVSNTITISMPIIDSAPDFRGNKRQKNDPSSDTKTTLPLASPDEEETTVILPHEARAEPVPVAGPAKPLRVAPSGPSSYELEQREQAFIKSLGQLPTDPMFRAQVLNGGLNMVSVNQDDLIHRSQKEQLMAQFQDQAPAPVDAKVQVSLWNSKAGAQVSTSKVTSTHRRKHHINQVAAQALAMERELAIKRAAGYEARRNARRRYGW